MTAQNAEKDDLPKRIRALRADESQSAFAKRAGITRSALANYETGRTKPKRSVLAQIADAAGVDVNAVASGDVDAIDDLVAILGVPHERRDDLLGLTGDERAIIRVLRFCNQATALTVVEALLDAIDRHDVQRAMIEPATVKQDINALLRIRECDGLYDKAIVRANVEALLLDLMNTKRKSS